MKDFTKRELSVGDKVVHGVGGRYGGLDGPYWVLSFTPKMVRLTKENHAGAEVYKIVPPGNLVKVPA